MTDFLFAAYSAEVLAASVFLFLAIGLARPAVASGMRTYYTDARMEVVRHNLEHYDWAREHRSGILEKAEHWAGYDDAKLRTLVSPPQVPRGYQVHNDGCPVHGVKVHEQGLYRWIIDFDRPYKVTCPVGGETYPSNDFEAFSGHGHERQVAADRSVRRRRMGVASPRRSGTGELLVRGLLRALEHDALPYGCD